MKAIDAIKATATVLSQMNPSDRAAVARVLTMPIHADIKNAIYEDVRAIATRSVTKNHMASASSPAPETPFLDELLKGFKR